MNPVLILTRNCLELTKKCVESVLAQDIPVQIEIIDNGSTDGTQEWWAPAGVSPILFRRENLGVSKGWNDGLSDLFTAPSYRHVLCLNNDTILPPWFYHELLSYDEPFVTGVAVDDMSQIAAPAPRMPLNPHPDFSAFLIRRDCWEKVGPFDERMKLYASDADYHIRAHRLGVPLWKANVPYHHINSQTMKRADPDERSIIQAQANKDREVFRSIYNCLPGDPAYYAIFGEGASDAQS